MSTSVNISTLMARLARYIRLVIKGHKVTILDRRHPVARLVHADSGSALATVKPLGNPSFLDYKFPKPVSQVQKIDSVSLLLEERSRR